LSIGDVRDPYMSGGKSDKSENPVLGTGQFRCTKT
jgi:hypothetical protein